MISSTSIAISDVRDILSCALPKLRTKKVAQPTAKLAAVLVIIYPKNGNPTILLTKRSRTVEKHKGQVSFPGGAYENRDGNLLQTALRETREELELNTKSLQIVGELDDVFTSRSNFIVTPYVAFAPDLSNLDPNITEVTKVIEAPINVLANPGIYKEEIWNVKGVRSSIFFYSYFSYKIWGLTACILKQLLDLLSPKLGLLNGSHYIFNG